MNAAAPRIQSVGTPPDRHAERIVDEFLAHLHDRRRCLYANARVVTGPERMGNPKAQFRAAERIRKAMGDTLLDIRLKPARRGKFVMQVVDWGVWDPVANNLVSDIAPMPATTAW